MTFNEYQIEALKTAINNYEPLMGKTIWAMGIAGEAGEVIEKWKKIVAYNNGEVDDQSLQEITKEIGDVIWYCAVFASSLGVSFDTLIETNLKKLKDRQKRSVIKGIGDNR